MPPARGAAWPAAASLGVLAIVIAALAKRPAGIAPGPITIGLPRPAVAGAHDQLRGCVRWPLMTMTGGGTEGLPTTPCVPVRPPSPVSGSS